MAMSNLDRAIELLDRLDVEHDFEEEREEAINMIEYELNQAEKRGREST